MRSLVLLLAKATDERKHPQWLHHLRGGGGWVGGGGGGGVVVIGGGTLDRHDPTGFGFSAAFDGDLWKGDGEPASPHSH